MGYMAIIFSIDVLVSTLSIWIATKFSFVDAELKIIAVIIVFVSILSLIPVAGWLIGIIAFFYLLIKLTGCSFGDAIWVVLFAKLASFIVSMVFLG